MDPTHNSQHLPSANEDFSVPSDDTVADVDLQDDKDQALDDAAGSETASDILLIPEDQVKEGLDEIAFDEKGQGAAADADEGTDDWREHVEDMDESDKDR